MSAYLIWSLEHRAWWKPDANGYTDDVDQAGRFPLIQALEHCTAPRGAKVEEIAIAQNGVAESERSHLSSIHRHWLGTMIRDVGAIAEVADNARFNGAGGELRRIVGLLSGILRDSVLRSATPAIPAGLEGTREGYELEDRLRSGL